MKFFSVINKKVLHKKAVGFDVLPVSPRVLKLKEKKWGFQFSKSDLYDFFFKNKKKFSFIIVFLIVSIIWYSTTTYANTVNLYASSCLGGWENTGLAVGEPNVLGTEFNDENSAKLSLNTHSQIFCGDFKGDVLEKTIPKKIVIKFSWGASYPSVLDPNLNLSTTTDEVLEDNKEEDGNLEAGNVSPESTPDLGGQKLLEQDDTTIETKTTSPSVDLSTTTEKVLEASQDKEGASQEEKAQSIEGGAEGNQTDSIKEAPPTPQDETVSFLRLFTKTVFAEEGLESTSTTTEEISKEVVDKSASTTINEALGDDTVGAEKDNTYGLVEVLYTLNGQDWKSLGFVSKNEFNGKSFEIPIEEASDWEDISKIQVGVQSVPVIDDVVPTIYLDAVWIEVEYEDISDGSLISNTLDSLENILSDKDKDLPKEEVLDENIDNQSEEDMSEDEEEYTPPDEYVEEVYEEPKPSPKTPLPPIYSRKYLKDIRIDNLAEYKCKASPFTLDLSGKKTGSVDILLNTKKGGEYELEVGSLPDNLDVRFSNNKYSIDIDGDAEKVSLNIKNELIEKGNFSFPVFFKERKGDSGIICQVNILNK